MSKRKREEEEETALCLMTLPPEIWCLLSHCLLEDAGAALCMLATSRAALPLMYRALEQYVRDQFVPIEHCMENARSLPPVVHYFGNLLSRPDLCTAIRNRLADADGNISELLCELLYLVFIARRSAAITGDFRRLGQISFASSDRMPLLRHCWFVTCDGRVVETRQLGGVRAMGHSQCLASLAVGVVNRLPAWQAHAYSQAMSLAKPLDEQCRALCWELVQHHGTEVERAACPLVKCTNETLLRDVVLHSVPLYAVHSHTRRDILDRIYEYRCDRGSRDDQRRDVAFSLKAEWRSLAIYDRLVSLLPSMPRIILRDVEAQ